MTAQGSSSEPDDAARQAAFSNRVETYASVFHGITPWAGDVPMDHLADFTGALTAERMTGSGDPRFRIMARSSTGVVATRLPTIEDGEAWFEAVDWVLAAREARERFVMMTLGS